LAVGFIALAGVAAEFGVVKLVYLDNAFGEYQTSNRLNNYQNVKAAIMEGAVLRVRPKAMTVAVIIAGLLPIMLGHGTGSFVKQRIKAKMVGRDDYRAVVVIVCGAGGLFVVEGAGV